MHDEMENSDRAVVEDFGAEWERFDQNVEFEELNRVFNQYFAVFPWEELPESPVGFDLGCGTGRWARFVAPKVARLHCIDPSSALEVARANIGHLPQCEFHRAGVDNIPLPDGSMDFGYSLGVLHHVPDTQAGIRSCVEKLKPGAPFLIYLYYAFDNRPAWFRQVWRASDRVRKRVSTLPKGAKHFVADCLAAGVYYPLARGAAALERVGLDVENVPLSAYRHRSFYMMRTDALDRFGTRLEQRFTAAEVRQMMLDAGLTDVVVSPGAPYWCAVGRRG